MSTPGKRSVGIVGARGHTGAELIRLIARHPQLELVFVSSRELDGRRLWVNAYANDVPCYIPTRKVLAEITGSHSVANEIGPRGRTDWGAGTAHRGGCPQAPPQRFS